MIKLNCTMSLPVVALLFIVVATRTIGAFVMVIPPHHRATVSSSSSSSSLTHLRMSDDDVLNKAIEMMTGGGGGGGNEIETPDMVQGRIQALVDQHPVLLFMKGAKTFPQCGFSDTATKILDRFRKEMDFDYHTVDVLADPMIRDGIKMYSQWPTIPQLYVNGEFTISIIMHLNVLYILSIGWTCTRHQLQQSTWFFLTMLSFQSPGEFIGGSDIMLEMYENGELKQAIEAALISKE